MEINGRTRLCILIGDPVEHSVSPQIHNSGFQALGLNYVYAAFAVKNLKEAVAGIRGFGIRGASVTFPHKQNIIPLLDCLDPLAKKIGAVNTVVNDNGRLAGHNTDGQAAYLSLTENGVSLADKKIVILGAGGASRAISFTIASKKTAAEIVLSDLANDRSSSLAKEVSRKTGADARAVKFNPQALAAEIADADILINTSPVGIYPKIGQSPIPKDLIRKGLCVFDIVYNPAQTLFLKYARAAGCKTIPGIEMLVRQAGEQFRLWTGKKPPLEVMFKAGRKGLERK
jgi:shikimate dehydrogenase